MKRFNDKAVIITGADSSLGRETALWLAKEGANVILLGTNTKVLEYIIDELPEDHTWINSGNHLSITYDVNNEKHGEKLTKYILDKYHRVDILININTEFEISNALLTELTKTKGNIVNVSLLSDTGATWSTESYKSTLLDLEQNTQQQALEYGSKGIRVNGIVAGLTSEDSDDIENVNIFNEQSPLGRLVEIEEISEVILFLASHNASMITGTTLAVDGGFNLSL